MTGFFERVAECVCAFCWEKTHILYVGVRSLSRTTSSTLIQFVQTLLPQIIRGKAFWYKYVVSADLSKLCVWCDLDLGGEVILIGYGLQLPSVSLCCFVLAYITYLYLFSCFANVCASFEKLQQGMRGRDAIRLMTVDQVQFLIAQWHILCQGH